MGFNIYIFLINLFSFGCTGSLLLCGLSLVAESGGYSSLRSAGSRRAGSVVVARGLSSCGTRALECRLSSCGVRA